MIIILHISQAGGGVKTYIDNIAKYNPDKKSYKHYLISSKDYLTSEEFLFEKHYILPSFVRSPNLLKDIAASKDIIKIIREIKPDIIHCHSAKGGMHGRFAGFVLNIPTIFTPNAFSFLGYAGLKRKGFKKIESATKFKSYLLAVSNSESERAIHEVGYNKNKVFTVDNYTEVSEIVNRNYELKNKIGMIGRMTFQKNPLLFLKLAHHVSLERPGIKFILLGAGYHDHLASEVKAYIKEYNLVDVVEIKDWSYYSNIKEFYNSIDIFLLTSKFEGLSFSLLESMSLGIPIVVTDADGNRDVINNKKNGYMSNDFSILKSCLLDLLKSQELREEIGLAGHNHVFAFNSSKNANKIYQLYASLVEHSSTGVS
ncbi:MAG: glycosyltransferase [Mucilaginibacter sp.]